MQASLLVVAQCLGIGLQLGDAIEQVVAAYFLKLRFAVEQQGHDVEIIVGPLGTIDDGPPFDGYTSAVGCYLWVGFHGAWLHIEGEGDAVALLPSSVDGQVAIFADGILYGLAIDSDGVAEALVVGIAVEIRRNHLSLDPSGDTQFQGERASDGAVNRESDGTIPWIVGLLGEGQPLALHLQSSRVADKEVYIDILVLHSIDIAGQ